MQILGNLKVKGNSPYWIPEDLPGTLLTPTWYYLKYRFIGGILEVYFLQLCCGSFYIIITLVNHSLMSDSSNPISVACQAPLSMGFSRQEYWSGLLFLSPGDLPDPKFEPGSSWVAGGFFNSWATREGFNKVIIILYVGIWIYF